jgi:two-component system, OmpR family, response regulator
MTSPTLNRILHVEDEPDIQEIARVSLETVGGFTVATCSSGREALDRAEEFEPDLLLLDVMMPDMDGPTTLGELRKLPGFERTPTIFMTAKVQAHEIERFKALGAIDVITKPFDPMTLADQVRAIWAQFCDR